MCVCVCVCVCACVGGCVSWSLFTQCEGWCLLLAHDDPGSHTTATAARGEKNIA